ncbi:Protein C14C6.2 [Aphelenchoides avenae]|nr:Protein C14C6.2 [Aphelenchus avenae]
MIRTRPFDCPELMRFCDDKTYREIMTHQCPRTCRRCNEAAANGTVVGCYDAKVQGRFSDCPASKKFCRDPVYEVLMALVCPKTCGYCKKD